MWTLKVKLSPNILQMSPSLEHSRSLTSCKGTVIFSTILVLVYFYHTPTLNISNKTAPGSIFTSYPIREFIPLSVGLTTTVYMQNWILTAWYPQNKGYLFWTLSCISDKLNLLVSQGEELGQSLWCERPLNIVCKVWEGMVLALKVQDSY